MGKQISVFLVSIIWCLVVLIIPGSSFAADPVVTNVVMTQRTDNSGLVDISYDIFDADGDSVAIALNISEDGGLTWHFPCPSVSGDKGQGIVSGIDKNIVWNLAQDSPDNPGVQLEARVIASDAGVEHTTHSPNIYWAMEFFPRDLTDTNLLERIAKADVFVFDGTQFWGHEVHEEGRVIEKLKEINPDLKVLAYVLAKTNRMHWSNSPEGSYTRTLYERTLPYWSYTTTGDTLMDWPNQVVLNILDSDCRDAIAGTMAEFSQASNNQVDGVFWDYFALSIWISPYISGQVEGDPDMDGDGIPMAQDSDEIEAFQAACDSLVMRTRELMGDDFIQVFNGPRASMDSTFAALGDGMYYEIFPTQVFPDPPMASALDPDYENNLFRVMTWPRTRNGGPYNVLGNMNRNIYFDQNGEPTYLVSGNAYRAVGLLTGNYSTWLGDGGHNFDWPEVEINLGLPLAPTVINGDHYFRQYQYGTIDLHMGTGNYPNAFSYEIKINGRVVEALNIPYHYP